MEVEVGVMAEEALLGEDRGLKVEVVLAREVVVGLVGGTRSQVNHLDTRTEITALLRKRGKRRGGMQGEDRGGRKMKVLLPWCLSIS